jgi:ATP phosphoribosyltransferase
MSATLTLAIPKGRLETRVVSLLSTCGFAVSFEDRRLVTEDRVGQLRCLLVKNSDLPTYVHHGIAGLGVCGSDVIYESAHQFVELLRFPFGGTRMCLAGRHDNQMPPAHGTIRVATKFPRFARDFFHARGIPVDLIKLDGSVELAPVLGLAPYIVDLVETGSTLEANGLAVIDELAEVHVALIANTAFYKYHHQQIDRLVDRLREGSL